MCVPCIKPVKYITFLRHTITNKNRNDFLHAFVYFEYKWRNIYSGVNICGNLSSFCGAFFLRIAGWKIRTRKNFVPHGSCDQFNISALQVLQGISSLCLVRRLYSLLNVHCTKCRRYTKIATFTPNFYSFYAVLNVPTHAHWFLKQKILLFLSSNI